MTRKLVIAAQKLIEDVNENTGVGATVHHSPMHLIDAIKDALPNEHTRHCYIGAPEAYDLDHVAHFVGRAFGETCYLVGSATEKRDFRDVDVRMIFSNEKWDKLFGGSHGSHSFFWSLITVSVSEYMSKRTGLKIDFQIQKRANVKESDWEKVRQPLGLFYLESDAGAPDWKKTGDPE